MKYDDLHFYNIFPFQSGSSSSLAASSFPFGELYLSHCWIGRFSDQLKIRIVKMKNIPNNTEEQCFMSSMKLVFNLFSFI